MKSPSTTILSVSKTIICLALHLLLFASDDVFAGKCADCDATASMPDSNSNASSSHLPTTVDHESCYMTENSYLCDEKNKGVTDPWFLSEEANSCQGDSDDFWNELDCDEVFAEGTVRPIHNTSTWQFLRGVYFGVVGLEYSTIALEHLLRDTGFAVPVRVEQIPGKGRGIIALQDIPEGTFVWDAIHTARFPSPVMYRRFLASMPHDLACDIMVWAYVEDYPIFGPAGAGAGVGVPLDGSVTVPTISVDLDPGSFMNTISGNTTTNLDPETYKTNRLVKAGEELILDYRDFEKDGYWNAAGFGSRYPEQQWL